MERAAAPRQHPCADKTRSIDPVLPPLPDEAASALPPRGGRVGGGGLRSPAGIRPTGADLPARAEETILRRVREEIRPRTRVRAIRRSNRQKHGRNGAAEDRGAGMTAVRSALPRLPPSSRDRPDPSAQTQRARRAPDQDRGGPSLPGSRDASAIRSTARTW